MTPRPGRPHFSNFSPPAERRPFCKKVFGLGGKAWFLAALVGHEGRWATLGGLVPICPWGTLVNLTSKYVTLVTTTPRGGFCFWRHDWRCGCLPAAVHPYGLRIGRQNATRPTTDQSVATEPNARSVWRSQEAEPHDLASQRASRAPRDEQQQLEPPAQVAL